MKRGVEELVEVLEEIKENALSNPCMMSDSVFSTIAKSLRALYNAKVPKKYSREQAAIKLGVSTRQLSRIADKRGIKPHRDGFKNVYYTEDDINEMK